jgi:tRNA (cmo5U34)-methyltransferase
MERKMSWNFDDSIAEAFVDHAKHHIPNYDVVIDKCISLCKYYLKKNSRIIDVGCATGETLRRLHESGFNNLTGVESSHAMLKHCNYNIARLLHNDRFPNEIFDAALCNWTLHFIKDKFEYLSSIYQNLNETGFLVLSEKTSLDPTAINLYHKWKLEQGVTQKEINYKEVAIKDVMYINDPKWYIDTLTCIGFKNIQIIDATWCFTTFTCTKQ